MDYELAQRLRDAGFQKEWIFEADGSLRECAANLEISLEELIYACGEVDLQVNKFGSSCIQWGNSDEDGTPYRYDGPTPLIAVANLFFALNAK